MPAKKTYYQYTVWMPLHTPCNGTISARSRADAEKYLTTRFQYSDAKFKVHGRAKNAADVSRRNLK